MKKELQIFLDAFFDLNTDRAQGMSLGSIPWSSILSYVQYKEYNECTCEDMFYFLREIDKVYLKHARKNG